MIVLTAVYLTRPEETEEILVDLAEMRARVSADEPGCLTYRVHRQLDEPHRLMIYEAYRDEDSLNAHRNTAHFRTIVMERIVPRLLSRERTLWVSDDFS